MEREKTGIFERACCPHMILNSCMRRVLEEAGPAGSTSCVHRLSVASRVSPASNNTNRKFNTKLFTQSCLLRHYSVIMTLCNAAQNAYFYARLYLHDNNSSILFCMATHFVSEILRYVSCQCLVYFRVFYLLCVTEWTEHSSVESLCV